MNHLLILLLLGLFTKSSFSQSNHPSLLYGKYEGIEIRYLKQASDTTNRVDLMNETWGKKTLTLDSNGSFLLEFPVPYPTTAIGLKRTARGSWVRINDTLILNSYHPYSDFVIVKESQIKGNHIQVKLKYSYEGKEYFPGLSVRINNKREQMIETKSKIWTYLPLDTVKTILIEHWAGPTSTDHEWIYRPINKNSNSFVITVTDNGDDINYIVEDYKLLITDSSLIQIDQVFWLRDNCFRAKNLR